LPAKRTKEAEAERLRAMMIYEEACYARGVQTVCGVDEVGRGPLAGPVAAAAVILPRGLMIEGLNDSKKMSEAKRRVVYEVIMREAIAVAVALVSPREIDEINILNATMAAMKAAVGKLAIKPEYVLVDGNRMPDWAYGGETIVSGDAKSVSIAAASVVAKVTRDEMMAEYDAIYPGYGFAQHKGYGTAAHVAAIGEQGLSPIHRVSFCKKEWLREPSE